MNLVEEKSLRARVKVRVRVTVGARTRVWKRGRIRVGDNAHGLV